MSWNDWVCALRNGGEGVGARSWISILAVFGLCFLGGGLAVGLVVDPKSGIIELRPVEAAAAANGDSYTLNDFTVQYPYLDPRSDLVPDESLAGVEYTAAWTGTRFPGPARCQIALRDTAGEVVGTKDFTLESGGQSFRSDFEPVNVSGIPESAEGACGPGNYPEGSGYAIESSGVTASGPGRARMDFTVQWTTPSFPGMRSCELIVSLRNGQTESFGPFSVSVGREGQEISLTPPVDAAAIKDADFRCEAF